MLQRSHHTTDLTRDLVVVMGKRKEERDSEEEGGRDVLKGVRMAFGG